MQDIAGHVVICSGDASFVLAVDAHGAPISDETACPECSCLNPIDADMIRGVALTTPAAGHYAETLRQQDVYQKIRLLYSATCPTLSGQNHIFINFDRTKRDWK